MLSGFGSYLMLKVLVCQVQAGMFCMLRVDTRMIVYNLKKLLEKLFEKRVLCAYLWLALIFLNSHYLISG